MQNSTFCRRIPVVQGDTARTFRFILEDITLDGTEHARIYARKPSGAEIYDECDVIGSNEVIFTPETEQIFIETGIIPAEIRVAKGEKLITSYSFEFEVRQSAMRTGDIPSSDEFNALERAIEEAKGLREPEFTEAGKRENIVSGETMQILFGKIKKWFTDLGALIIKIGNKDISSIGDGTVTGAITDLDKRNTKNTSDIDIERKRIDNIAKLPEGATTGDAELTDIRVGADGTTYGTAGEAVRQQVSSLKKELTSLKVSAVYDETIGDLSFNAVESLVSAYPVGLENAEIEAVGSEMSSTAVVTENKNFSYTKKFVLQEGVYIIPPVWKSDNPNYGYNTIRLIEFLKDDDSVCTGATFSRAYPSGGSEKTSTIIAVVDSDKVYTVSNNNEVIEKFRFKKNTESVIAPVTFDIVQMIQDGLNISTSQYYIVFDITKQIPPNKVIGIKKMTHNAGTMVTYANKYGTYTTVRTANKIIPTGKSWDSTYFRNQISTDGTTTWLSIGGEGDYLYNALVELNYKIFVE